MPLNRRYITCLVQRQALVLLYIFIFIHRKGSRTKSLTNLTKQQTQYVKAVNLHSKLATRFRHKSVGISNEKHS